MYNFSYHGSVGDNWKLFLEILTNSYAKFYGLRDNIKIYKLTHKLYVY